MVAEVKIRSFLAIELPDEIKELLRREAGATENIHITLRFLGEVEETILSGDLSRQVAATVSHYPTLQLAVEGAGVFPDLGRPRVSWIGLGGDLPTLSGLHAEIEKILISFPIHREPPRRSCLCTDLA